MRQQNTFGGKASACVNAYRQNNAGDLLGLMNPNASKYKNTNILKVKKLPNGTIDKQAEKKNTQHGDKIKTKRQTTVIKTLLVNLRLSYTSPAKKEGLVRCFGMTGNLYLETEETLPKQHIPQTHT